MNKLESRELVPELRFPEFIASQEWRLTTFGEEAIFINGKAYKQDELLDKECDSTFKPGQCTVMLNEY